MWKNVNKYQLGSEFIKLNIKKYITGVFRFKVIYTALSLLQYVFISVTFVPRHI